MREHPKSRLSVNCYQLFGVRFAFCALILAFIASAAFAQTVQTRYAALYSQGSLLSGASSWTSTGFYVPTSTGSLTLSSASTSTSTSSAVASGYALSLRQMRIDARTAYFESRADSPQSTSLGSVGTSSGTVSSPTSFSSLSSTGGLPLEAAPEPATWIAGGLAFAALLITQRRRLTRLLKHT